MPSRTHPWLSLRVRAAFVGLVILLKAYVDGLTLPGISASAFFVVVAILEEVGRAHPRWAARLYITRARLTLAFALSTLGLGAALIAIGATRRGGLGVQEAVSFGLQGLIMGVLLRVLLTGYFVRMLRGAHIEGQTFLLLTGLGLFVVLLPTGQTHRHFTGFFLAGAGLGFALHYAVRWKEHSLARHRRRLQNIVHTSQVPSTAEATNTSGPADDDVYTLRVARAIEAFADHDWDRFETILDEAPGPETGLVLLRAAQSRLYGRYDDALAMLGAELRRGDRTRALENLLHLQLALNLGELGRDDEMFDALRRSDTLNSACTLTNATLALRFAERVPTPDLAAAGRALNDDQLEAISRIWKAIESQEHPHVERRIALAIGTTVPMTWTFMLDACGYVYLKAGALRFAKSLFVQCIHEDPMFSSPYLHLGEWHMAQVFRPRPKPDPDEQAPARAARLALLCLRIAETLEGKKDSRVRKRARVLLVQLRPAEALITAP